MDVVDKGWLGKSWTRQKFKTKAVKQVLYLIDINNDFDSLVAVIEYNLIKEIRVLEDSVVQIILGPLIHKNFRAQLNECGEKYMGWEKGIITMHVGAPQPHKPCNQYCNNRKPDYPNKHDVTKGDCHWVGCAQMVKDIVAASRLDEKGRPKEPEAENDLSVINFVGDALRFNSLPPAFSRAMMFDAKKVWDSSDDSKTAMIKALTKINSQAVEIKEVLTEHNEALDRQHEALDEANKNIKRVDKKLVKVGTDQFGEGSFSDDKDGNSKPHT